VDLKTLCAKISALSLEDDFLSAALGNGGHPSAMQRTGRAAIYRDRDTG
jgi:hypothetical protein